jgi:hypothetical protein
MVNHGMILVMAADTSPGVTLTDVLERYGQHWHIEAAEFCYVAVRRPTPTRQEIVTGRNPAQLALKLAAGSGGSAAHMPGSEP